MCSSDLIDTFTTIGLMNKLGDEEIENYAIEPTIIMIENKVANHVCDTCGSKLFVAASDTISIHTKCLDYTCTGTYSQIQKSKPNYYQLVYTVICHLVFMHLNIPVF